LQKLLRIVKKTPYPVCILVALGDPDPEETRKAGSLRGGFDLAPETL
jgi:hypothetical protein